MAAVPTEEQEKRAAVREAMRPYKKTARVGCRVVPLVMLGLACAGYWLPALVLLLVAIVTMMMLGSWMGRQGPADGNQRTAFETSISLSALTHDKPVTTVGRLLTLLLKVSTAPFRWLLVKLEGQGQYLRALHDDSREPWLLGQLQSPVAFDRWRAAVVLGERAKPSATEDLVGRLEDEDPRVREAATAALAKTGDPVALEALRSGAARWDDDVQWLQAVAGLYDRGHGVPVDVARLERAVNLVLFEGNLDRTRIGGLLGSLPLADSEDAIRRAIATDPSTATEALSAAAKQGQPARQLLLDHLRAADPIVIRAALLGLMKLEDPSTKGDIEGQREHPDPDVRKLATLVVNGLNVALKAEDTGSGRPQ
jgi:hypothetical protein